jgi:hypothetical protein
MINTKADAGALIYHSKSQEQRIGLHASRGTLGPQAALDAKEADPHQPL